MKAIAISEQMMFNTVRLKTDSGTGTGFFFRFDIEGKKYPVIITNKHVVNNKKHEKVIFSLHLSDDNDSSSENTDIECETDWFFHSEYDLCFCFIEPISALVKEKTGKTVFCMCVDEDKIPDKEKMDELSQLEEVVMIGYPIGLFDEKNNFPIFRKGYTATHPAIDFRGERIGLVDMACFPGSSGSPIFILNEHGYSDKYGHIRIGGSRVLLLGIQYAVPIYDAFGQVEITTQVPIMSVKTQQMTNLGYYIKSCELLELKNIAKKIIEEK